MNTVNIAEGQVTLSRLVERAEPGEEEIPARRDRPVVLSERETKRYPRRGLGIDRGQFEVPDDFDDDLPPESTRHSW